MFQTLDGFLKSWEYEAGATQRVLNNLTDESLRQEITLQNWTLGRIAWHIVTAIHVMTSRTGLTFESPSEDWPVPTSAQFIADSYSKASNAFIQAVKNQWTDDSLKVLNDFFGQQQPNAIFLMTLILHQNHHRGQMTVLMRQAGLTVPGIYGPSKEEWANIGMEAPKM
ncbi:DinB family protein [Bacillus songklensis]|uniref:DinB family protein n=1 Tax=Bacillus songklensis TaxID=1069116 RepID=A0ABV8AVT4_9BACI